MIDIHMHVIPGVDDGAIDFDMACQMVDSAYLQGVRGIIATPHSDSFICCVQDIHREFSKLSLWAAQKYPDLRLALGAEVYFSPYNTDDTLKALQKAAIPSLCASSFVLAEFSPYIDGRAMRTSLEKIIRAGWRPVIAHAERCPDALEDAALVSNLLSMGCLIQINAYSLAGERNPRILSLARTLLARRQVHFLGSDAHRMNHRPPNVADGIRYISGHCPATCG